MPKKRESEDKLYTASQVAELAGVTKDAVQKAIKRNQLVAQKLGTAGYIITESEMNRWIASKRKPGRPKVT